MGETTKIAWTDQGAARVHVRKYAESALRVIETTISSQRGQVALGRPAWRAASIVRQKRNTLFAEVLDASRRGADGDPVAAWDEVGVQRVFRRTVPRGWRSAPRRAPKQMGSRPYDSNVNASDWPDDARFVGLPEGVPITVAGAGVKLLHSKGEDPAEWPEDLRVQEWLEVRS